MASPPRARGRSRTRAPALSSPLSMRQAIDGRALLEQPPLPFVHGVPSVTLRRPRTAPCSFAQCSGGSASVRSRICTRALVRASRFALLLVGQRQDAQREDLVDLGAVEEVAGALRGNLRVVVEDDRRREHAVVAALRRRPAPARRRRSRTPAAMSRRSSGGSRSETRSPPVTRSTTCADTSDRQQRAHSRLAAGSSDAEVRHLGRSSL